MPPRDPLPAGSAPPALVVVDAVTRALGEDLLPLGDLSASVLPAGRDAAGAFVARTAGVVAGLACAAETFAQVDTAVQLVWDVAEGDEVAPGAVVGRVRGPLASVLAGERTACNFLSHLSGVATATRRYVDAAGGEVVIWDTRKTTPGLRSLEKAAVRAGGGANHRGNLSDWVMLKDNHLAHLDLPAAVAAARTRWPGRTVHVECDRLEQVGAAIDAGAGALLLDNMSPAEVREAVALVDERAAGGPRPLLEVSGGITLETVTDYAATGVDCISVGALTNAAGVLDIGLDLDDPRASGA